MEDARFDGEREAQAHLMLGMIYLRNADLHEAFARTAAAAQLDYLDKLTRAAGEARSRYARLYLAEALLARGSAREAARHFERVRGRLGGRATARSPTSASRPRCGRWATPSGRASVGQPAMARGQAGARRRAGPRARRRCENARL